ncbi:MAG: hypothetical protein QOD06_2765 [Candidatus Binatota bacterium]|nr:hypothetical protein [Candidatus Binatota bacterium]
MITSRDWWIAAAISGAALAIRIAVGFAHAPWASPPAGDAVDYWGLAQTLHATGTYGFGGAPSAYRMPGLPSMYAAYLTLGGTSFGGARLVVMTLSAISAGISFLAALRFLPRRRARFVGTIMALEPYGVLFASLGVADPVASTFLLIGLWALAEGRDASAGLAVGIAMLVHPFFAFFVVTLCVALLAGSLERTHPIRASTRFALTAAAVLVPWMLRNAYQLDSFVPLSTGGGEVLYGAHNEKTFGSPEWMGDWAGMPLVRPREHGRLVGGRKEVDADQERRRLAFQEIARNLERMPSMIAAKLGRFLGIWAPKASVTGKGTYNVLYWIACLAGLIVIACEKSRANPLFVASAYSFAGTLAATVVLYGNPRFRLPVTLFSAIALAALIDRAFAAVAESASNVRRGSARVNRH